MSVRFKPSHLFWCALCFVLLQIGCASSQNIKDGQHAYELKKYALAADLLKEDYQKADNAYEKYRIAYQIGQAYHRTNQYAQASTWYEKSLDNEFDLDVLLALARSLKTQEKYTEAVEQLDKYIDEERFDNKAAQNERKGALLAMDWMSSTRYVDVSSLPAINSGNDEFSPWIDTDGNVVYTSTGDATGDLVYEWTNSSFGDLVKAQSKSGKFERVADYFNVINDKYYEGVACFNSDESEIYYTSCGEDGLENAYCHIMLSEMDAGVWQNPVKVPLFHDSCNVMHPFLMNDKTLLFASDHEDGFGGYDLFITTKTNTGWSTPLNLGKSINTSQDELFPHIDDLKRLYFASNGHVGMGGLDVFVANKKGNTWTKPSNLEYPINSGADDFGVFITKSKPKTIADKTLREGYVSSNRKGGKGGDDIYKFEYQNINLYDIHVTVYGRSVFESQDTSYEIVERLDLAQVSCTASGFSEEDSSTSGLATFTDVPENKQFKLFASKPGYFNKSASVNTIDKKSLDSIRVVVRTEVYLEKIIAEKEIELSNIYYDLNEATLREESFPALDSLLSVLNENPTLPVEIGSHTDSRGSKPYNQKLSQARAQSVVDYLIENGIPETRLIAKGYGEDRLTNRCADGVECTEEEHQQNRRTTFRVISDEADIKSQ